MNDARALRVLVLAPFGRDGQITCELLHDAGFAAVACADVAQLRERLREGAGTLVVAVEALRHEQVRVLAEALREQPPWSDVPLVLVTAAGEVRAAREYRLQALEDAGHVTLLDRPVRVASLVSVVRSALATRRRQYEMREMIEELQLGVERLDAEHEVRERFVSLLAHDLRGPLTAVKMTAQLLNARPQGGAPTQQLAGRIEKNVDRADQMIRNLLDAHRLRAGHRLPLEPRACDLAAIAREATEDFGEAHTIAIHSPEGVTGYWDPDLLRRAIWNLSSNAIKYGASDRPVEITLAQSQGGARITVHNWGPGMSAEEQRELLTPFSRARRRSAPGWGLGLTLVQGVADAHGGRLTVSSDPDAGTAFTLHLPLDARASEAAAADTGSSS